MKKLHLFTLITGVILASCAGNALQFSNYEKTEDAASPDGVPAEIRLSFAVPQGKDATAANIIKAEKEIIAGASMAEELGAPAGETLQAIADNYIEIFRKGIANEDLPPSCVYDLQIVSTFCNDKIVVFNVTDGVYGNGGPQEYLRIVSLADGRIIERDALTTMNEADVVKLGLLYGDKDLKEFLGEMKPENFWIAPDSAGCKVKIHTFGHFFTDFTVPTENIAFHLTNEGKALFGVTGDAAKQ